MITSAFNFMVVMLACALKGVSPSRPYSMKPGPQESIQELQSRSAAVLMMENGQLMAQGNHLCSYITSAADE